MGRMGNNGSEYHTVLYNILAIFIVGIWGASFVATKILLNAGLEPLMIYLLRFSIAYLVLSVFRFKRLWADSIRDELLLFVCGITGGALYYVSENMALSYTYVANVSLIVSLTPIFTALFVSLFYRTDRVGALFFVASLIAIAGVGVVVLGDADGELGFNFVGDLLSLGAAISWGVYSLILKGLIAKYNADFVTRKTLFYGVVVGLPFLLLSGNEIPYASLLNIEVISSLLFLALGATLFCYFMWNVAVTRLGIVHLSNYIYFIPIVAILLSSALLGESVSITLVLGGLMVIGGVVIAEKLGNSEAS